MQAIYVQGNATMGRESLKEFAHQFGVESANFLGRNFQIANQVRACGQVERASYLRVIHRKVALAIAADTALVAQSLAQRLTKRDTCVLDRMVVVNVQITFGADRHIYQRMAGQLVQHVVEKPNPGVVVINTGAIEIDLDRDIRLSRAARDFGCSHGALLWAIGCLIRRAAAQAKGPRRAAEQLSRKCRIMTCRLRGAPLIFGKMDAECRGNGKIDGWTVKTPSQRLISNTPRRFSLKEFVKGVRQVAALTADTAASAVAMASEILGSGFTINSATYSGDSASSAIYTGGDTTNPGVLPSDTGVIFSTGNVSSFANASGANNTAAGTTTNTAGVDGNAAFDAAAGQATFDASFLEINFTPEPGQTSINIEFRFYSEEYNEYVYSNFNDIALVQLNGVTQPISVGSGEISVNGINNAGTFNPTNGNEANDPNPGNGQFDSANPNLYVDNSGGTYATEMDGFTVTLSLDIPVTPGVAQTLLIGIADVGDTAYDSSIVIASNNLPDTSDTDPIAADDTGVETWGTSPKTVDVLANDTDPNGQALTITQINGVDVVSGQTVTLATGQAVTLNPNGTITLVNTGGQTGETSFSYTIADTDGNTDSAFVTFDAAPICYCTGTLIETPSGPRAIEALRSGDLVLTRDEGPQPIRWVGSRHMYASARHAPIEFAAGAIGNTRVLRVSPQHRILQTGHRAQLYFGQEEVLIAARHLVDGGRVRQLASGLVSYHHLMFDRHQIITANGAASESYQPGDFSLPGLQEASREELFELFPELRSNPTGYGQSARESVSGSLAHVFAA